MMNGETDHAHAHHRHGADDRGGCGHHASNAAADPHETATDPVCGMNVDPTTSKYRLEHRGRTFHFCSARCREKFAAAPAGYLKQPTQPASSAPEGTIYTCPMHPQIRQEGPGNCPICGMALEPLDVTAEAGPNAELIDMSRRFWIGLVLALPVVALEMGAHIPALGLHDLVPPRLSTLLQFLLATPVVLWAGWPFFERAWASVDPSQPEHVQPDRARHRRGLSLQPRRHFRARHLPGRIPRHGRHRRRLLRGRPRSSRCWSCSDRCWSCGRASRPAAPFARCSISRPRPPGASRRAARTKRFRSSRCMSGDRLRVRPGDGVPVDGVAARRQERRR